MMGTADSVVKFFKFSPKKQFALEEIIERVVEDETKSMGRGEVNWLFNVTISDIPVIYVKAHRCAGGLKEVVPTVRLQTP